MSPLAPGWAATALGEIAEVRLGRQRSPKNHTGLRMRPYLRAANVTWNGLDLADVKEMNFTEAESETYELRFGDVLVSEASGSASEVGKPVIWRGEIEGCCFQNTLVRIRTQHASSEYLRYYLLAEARSGRIGNASPGVGINHIGAARLSAWPVPLPPLNEQGRIVAAIEEHLSRLDAADASCAAASKRLEGLRRATVEAVTRQKGHRVAVREVAEVQGGIQKQPKRRPTKNRYPFLRVANVHRGRLDLKDVHEIELFDGELERLALRNGDLLVVEGNGSADQIGRSALWQGEIDPCVHQNHLIRVRPGPSLDPRYLDLYWNAPSTAQHIASIASSTSGLFTLSATKVRSVEVVVPPLDEQRRIVAWIEEQLSAIDVLRAAIERAQRRSASLRRAVLERAFRGELVPQNPTDEPAELLLARIRADRTGSHPAVKTRRVRRR